MTNVQSAVSRYNPSHEDLTVLLDAAIEIDGFARGNQIDPSVFSSLAERLGFDRDITNADALSRLVDSRGIDIYNRTLQELSAKQANTIDELAHEIQRYVHAFRREPNALSVEELTAIKDFCLALHREILAESYEYSVEPNIDAA